MVPKILYPDFYIPLSGNFIECKDGAYVRDEQWLLALRHMTSEQKQIYKVVIKNPHKMTKWSGISYGHYLTMAGIDWSEFPKAKDEWFQPKQI